MLIIIQLYCHGKTIIEVNEKLNSNFELVATWFHENCMLINPGKYD